MFNRHSKLNNKKQNHIRVLYGLQGYVEELWEQAHRGTWENYGSSLWYVRVLYGDCSMGFETRVFYGNRKGE